MRKYSVASAGLGLMVLALPSIAAKVIVSCCALTSRNHRRSSLFLPGLLDRQIEPVAPFLP